MVDNGLSWDLTSKMEDALQWSIDFYHIQKNDSFRLVYDQTYLEDKKGGVDRVQAAHYKTGGGEVYDNDTMSVCMTCAFTSRLVWFKAVGCAGMGALCGPWRPH